MPEVDHIRSTVDHLYDGHLDQAQQSFNAAMADKIGETLAVQKMEVASTMFQPSETPKE
jgi:hypothetical protein